MDLTEEDKKLLRILVEKEIALLVREGKDVMTDDNPLFEAGEEKYKEFLENLLKKI